ncbi:TRAP transporter substrate-binding protein DctP [Falsiroseomonas oryzae]|uniref:TRAP transporter substrate-binding protein DctP n=1 Tax=Falsiroseomonas oryzae TaxID=2766473 RepID=UPI0022EAE5F0|nr:TRAP transporter substrate-binding protein DctP [Roseomonas sp. MO-31]
MPRTLRLHSFYGAHRPEAGLLDRFAAEAARLAGGELQVAVAHGNALGLDDAAALDWLPGGAAEMALLWSVHLQARVPALKAAYPMAVARDLEAHLHAIPALERLNREVLGEAGLHVLALFHAPVLHISVFSREVPVRSLATLRGLRLRVFSPDLEATFGRLGVDARFIPQGELYAALEARVFDATIYPACHTAWSVPLWRVARHAAYLFPEVLQPYVLALPAALWQALPRSAQAALEEAARLVWPDFLRHAYDRTAEDAARINLRAAGVQWHPDFDAADQQALAESAAETWRVMAEATGERAVLHRDRTLACMACSR